MPELDIEKRDHLRIKTMNKHKCDKCDEWIFWPETECDCEAT